MILSDRSRNGLPHPVFVGIKVPSSDQIFIGGGGILDYSKLKVPSPDKIFNYVCVCVCVCGGGGGVSRVLPSPSWSCMADSLSRTLRVWRLMK